MLGKMQFLPTPLILSYMYNISNMGANVQRAIKNELSHGKIYFPRCVV